MVTGETGAVSAESSTVRRRPRPVTSTLIRACDGAVAVACLLGPDTESAAAGLADFAGSAEQPGQVTRWLQDLYPDLATRDHKAIKVARLHVPRSAD